MNQPIPTPLQISIQTAVEPPSVQYASQLTQLQTVGSSDGKTI